MLAVSGTLYFATYNCLFVGFCCSSNRLKDLPENVCKLKDLEVQIHAACVRVCVCVCVCVALVMLCCRVSISVRIDWNACPLRSVIFDR